RRGRAQIVAIAHGRRLFANRTDPEREIGPANPGALDRFDLHDAGAELHVAGLQARKLGFVTPGGAFAVLHKAVPAACKCHEPRHAQQAEPYATPHASKMRGFSLTRHQRCRAANLLRIRNRFQHRLAHMRNLAPPGSAGDRSRPTTIQPESYFATAGFIPSVAPMRATVARCSLISAANSLPSPGLMTCPVASS